MSLTNSGHSNSTSSISTNGEKMNSLQTTIQKIFNCIKKQEYGKIYALLQSDKMNKKLIINFCDMADYCKRHCQIMLVYDYILQQYANNGMVREDDLIEFMGKYDKIEKKDQEKIISKVKLLGDYGSMRESCGYSSIEKDNEVANQSDNSLKIKELQIKIQNFQIKQAQLAKNTKNKEKDQLIKNKQIQKLIHFQRYFIDKSSLLSSISLNIEIARPFIKIIQEDVGKQIKNIKQIYSYQNQKNIVDRFHCIVDKKQNILLIAKTVESKLIGGFTTKSFNLTTTSSQQSTLQHAFLFNTDEKGLNIFPLKLGYSSISYDYNQIIFGNDQICIQRNQLILTSSIPFKQNKFLHYDTPQKKKYFVSDKQEGRQQIKLLGFQICIIQFGE